MEQSRRRKSEKASNLDAAGNGRAVPWRRRQANPSVTPVCNSSQALSPPAYAGCTEVAGQATSTEAGHVEPHGPARVGWAFSDGIQIARPANKDSRTRCLGAYEIGLANKLCFHGR